MSIPVNLVYEDDLSGFVMERLLGSFDDKFCICVSYNENGCGNIRSKVAGFNRASPFIPFFILTDLDMFSCPIALIDKWIDFDMNPGFIFRIAVREVEAWILADVEGFSKYLGISKDLFPHNADEVNDPKAMLLTLVGRSKKRVIKQDILPIDEYASIGPNYNERLKEFVLGFWNVERACSRSRSLAKAYYKLQSFEFKPAMK